MKAIHTDTSNLKDGIAAMQFTNEVGHTVEVMVHEDTMRKVDSIRMVITGHDSTTENIVTRNEAILLARALNHVLGDDV